MRFANKYGYCELNPFPGCSQIVISNHGVIFEGYRGQGHGTDNHNLRVARAVDLGYDLMLCTVNTENVAEKAILRKSRWKFLQSFGNTETKNQIELWSKQLFRPDQSKT